MNKLRLLLNAPRSANCMLKLRHPSVCMTKRLLFFFIWKEMKKNAAPKKPIACIRISCQFPIVFPLGLPAV